MDYLFVITGLDGEKVVYTDQGMFDYDEALVTQNMELFVCHISMKVTDLKHLNGSKKQFGIKFSLNALPMAIQAMTLKERKLGIPKMFPDRQDFYGEICKG